MKEEEEEEEEEEVKRYILDPASLPFSATLSRERAKFYPRIP